MFHKIKCILHSINNNKRSLQCVRARLYLVSERATENLMFNSRGLLYMGNYYKKSSNIILSSECCAFLMHWLIIHLIIFVNVTHHWVAYGQINCHKNLIIWYYEGCIILPFYSVFKTKETGRSVQKVNY